MSGWRLEPAAIQQILNQVGQQAAGLEQAVTADGLAGAVEKVNWGADKTLRVEFDSGFSEVDITGQVQAALEVALAAQAESIAKIGNHIRAGQQGVANATILYTWGQETMAAEFQAQAARSAESGNFDYFDAMAVWP